MANHQSHALPYPVRNARFTHYIPYLDADGDPLDPTSADTEVAKDGAGFIDCTEEITVQAGGRGSAYITLTALETDCNAYSVWAGNASAKATLLHDRPRDLPLFATGLVAAGGGASTITLPATGATVPQFGISGCWVRTTGGTGGGGANNQARRVKAHNGATRTLTVTPPWEVAPDATTVFDLLFPEDWASFVNMVQAGNELVPGAGGTGPVPALGIVTAGLAAGHTTTSLTLASTFSAANDVMVGKSGFIYSSTNGLYATFEITDWDNGTKVATVPAWVQEPTGVVLYVIYATSPAAPLGAAPVQVESFSPAAEAQFATMITNLPTNAELTAALASAVDPLPTNTELNAALAAADDAVLAAIGALNNLNAAGVRAAVGLAAPNLDAQLTAIPTNAELTAALAGLNDLAPGDVLTAVVEGVLTLNDVLRIFLGAVSGKSDGFVKGSGGTIHFRNQADTKNRITATVDAARNRTSVSVDPT